jgi:protease-4
MQGPPVDQPPSEPTPELPPAAPAPPPQTPSPPPAAPIPPPKRRNTLAWVLVALAVVIVLGGIAVMVALMSLVMSAGGGRGGAFGGQRVAVIRISGVIVTGESGGGLFGGGMAGSEEIIRQLHRARDDSSVKAIVLRINSPGGSPAASQEVYKEIMKIRRSKTHKKPIVVSMADVAASGGYYIAAAGDRIVANPATLTGSIGVIQEGFTFHEGLEKIGIKPVTIKTGKYKDTGSGLRPWRKDEVELMQTAINDVYDQFIRDVAEGRKEKLNEKKVRALADGRVFTGAQAHKNGLVDQLGNLQDAVDLAAKQAGIKGKPQVVNMQRPSPFDFLLTEAAAAAGRGFAEAIVREGHVGSVQRLLQGAGLQLR